MTQAQIQAQKEKRKAYYLVHKERLKAYGKAYWATGKALGTDAGTVNSIKYKKSTQPILPVSKYTFVRVDLVKIMKTSFIQLQVIQFPCPHCHQLIQKRVHTDGWSILTTCHGCSNQYSLTVNPVPNNKAMD